MPDFNDIERTTVKNMMLTASIRDIAFILDRSDDEIRLVMKQLREEDTVTRQDILDEKRKTKPAKKTRKKKVESQDQKLRRQRIEERNAAHRQRMNMMEAQRKQRLAARQPVFVTKEVDYSKMQSVRIDRRTTIILNPGEDKKAAVEKFISTYNKKSAIDD